MSKLPVLNDLGYYEIRMESIGGLGANLAGKILAEGIMLGLDLNVSNFSSYGSEKKGSPVKTYVRVSDLDVPIRDNGPVENPNLLVIFHENIVHSENVIKGVPANGVVVINSTKTPAEARDLIKLHSGTIYCVDAIGIAVEEKVRLNTTMLGAITRASGFIPKEAIADALKATFEKKYPHLVALNLKAFYRGYDEVTFQKFEADGKYPLVPYIRDNPRLGWDNQPIGGTIINPGNTILKDNSASREGFIPVINFEKCTSCGTCYFICPDLCIEFEEEKMKGINLRYCKGCGRCSEICPFDAITMEREK